MCGPGKYTAAAILILDQMQLYGHQCKCVGGNTPKGPGRPTSVYIDMVTATALSLNHKHVQTEL